MRILVAPDKFKSCLSASEVAANIALGLRDVLPSADITLMPIADGGEGTAAVICAARKGEWHACDVHDANGAIVTARYCTVASGTRAVLESSEAAGRWRIAPEQRDPDLASSFGVGEMLLDAARRGVHEILVGLGGSATNDGGFGMARALGFKFLNNDGNALNGRVSELMQLAEIQAPQNLRLPRIIAAADVRNPLLGPRGCTNVFSAQKGARAEQIGVLEAALARLASASKSDKHNLPGAGAAGGLGFGLAAFCGAEIRSGFGVVAQAIGLFKAIAAADVIITGEGRLDAQTLEGKAPAGVARLARKAGKRVFAIVGSADGAGLFDRIVSLTDSGIFVAEAMHRAPELLRTRAAELAQTLG